MRKDKFYLKLQHLLSFANVSINGDNPWDIQVHNRKFFPRVLAEGSLGLGEAYMDGWWNCARLDEFIHRVLRADLEIRIKPWKEYWAHLKAKCFNLQNRPLAFRNGQHHYDIGNDLYQCMLDNLRIYSCGYWKNASSLDEAQQAKLDLVCRKLQLEPGLRVLDIGCGWGGTAKFMAEQYQTEVVGITVSKDQAAFAKEFCRELPVDIRLEDYRSLNGTYDRIVSIGMFEHVGYKNYKIFMGIVRKHLKDSGLFLLQTIGGNLSVNKIDPWMRRYIFPNAMLPSARQVNAAIEKCFVLEDWHNFGTDYDKTLMHWFNNFDTSWNNLKENYSERFYRMWKFYLLSCAGTFRARKNQLWQIVLSPTGVSCGYCAPR